MDDARYEEILRRRERAGRFLALDHAARHPKKVAKPTTPRPKRAPDESGADRQSLREQHWAILRSRKAVQKALTKGLRAVQRAERRARVQAEREAAWEARKAARQAARKPVGQYGRPIGPHRRRGPAPGTYVPRSKGTTTMPTHCQGCGRRVRNQQALIGEHPGTVPYQGKGLCKGCNRNRYTDRFGRGGRPSRRPANCEGCGRPTRPRTSRSEDYPPGSIRYAGFGLCDSCSRGQDPARRKVLVHDGSTSCSDCGWTLRKRTTTLAEAPNTRPAWVRDGRGGHLCKTCHTRHRRNGLPV